MKEIQDNLRKLDRHLAYNSNSTTSTIWAVWIDNCCTVARVEDKIKEVFPNAESKLDACHWQQRWDAILEATTSKEAAYFRSAMRRAIFVVNEEEFERAKDVVQKKKNCQPTTKEILAEARTTTPGPALLRERVQKVLAYFMYLDSVANAALLNGEDANKYPRFFKPVTAAIRHAINRRLHYIDNGCLTDPTTCDMHIANAATGKHFIARGTSLNETVNKYLNALLGNSIGIDRADRLLNSFFEAWNHRIGTQRLGAEDFGTVKTEVLALLNSLADGAGYSTSNDDLPFPTLSVPKALPNKFNETMGLDFDLPHSDVSNPVAPDTDQTYEEPNPKLMELLENMDWDAITDEDIEPTEEEVTLNDDPIEAFGDLDNDEEDDPDASMDEQVEHLHLLVLDTKLPETSMQSFARLTNAQPWIPFRKANSTVPKTEFDLAEEGLFNQMSKDYKRHVSPGAPLYGYKDFELAWNIEVAERCRRLMDDGEHSTNHHICCTWQGKPW